MRVTSRRFKSTRQVDPPQFLLPQILPRIRKFLVNRKKEKKIIKIHVHKIIHVRRNCPEGSFRVQLFTRLRLHSIYLIFVFLRLFFFALSDRSSFIRASLEPYSYRYLRELRHLLFSLSRHRQSERNRCVAKMYAQFSDFLITSQPREAMALKYTRPECKYIALILRFSIKGRIRFDIWPL